MSGRRRPWLGFKGPMFKSYIDARIDAPPKPEFIRHSNTREQLRNLRNKCRHVIDDKDPEVVATGLRVLEAVRDEPVPEFGALHLMAAGIDKAEEEGTTWVQAMATLLDEFTELELPPPERTDHASTRTRR